MSLAPITAIARTMVARRRMLNRVPVDGRGDKDADDSSGEVTRVKMSKNLELRLCFSKR